MPTPTASAPWRIFLLIDPSTRPTNHPLGMIFYVGLRDELPQPVDLREATEPQALPAEETPARERLERLNSEGIRVLVEVIPEQWQESARPPGLPRVVGTLCATLHPAPLNVRHAGVRWPGALAQKVESAREVPVPDGGVIIRRHQGSVPVATLPLLDPDDLFEQQVEFVEGRNSPREVSNRLADGGPLPLFLVAEGRTERGVLPSNFVLGAWMIERIEPVDEERLRWRVVRADDGETEGALRRRYLHHLVDAGDPAVLRLRKA
ncbi:hypothetical protein [Mobilicoccus sp.]|uniref:hypothetical protein n=1 Tax=Mobilicoccus sp. TaxID=2034349 RepID=UPI00289DA643|nr:hypothetical protein [Mobilicoccus sp.]